MKLNDEIIKALRGCIEDSYEGVSEFARLTNVSADTLKKYLKHETQTIKDETWNKMYPLLKPYLKKDETRPSFTGTNKPAELRTDERILIDTFNDLPEDVRQQKLMEMIELAKKYNREKGIGNEIK